MRIISFDIGVHNFAYSIIDFNQNNNNWEIKHLHCHDFNKDKKIKDIIFDKSFWKKFHDYLISITDLLKDCDVFLIEKQLGFSKVVNYKAIQMSAQLFAHLIIQYPSKEIIEYLASNKTKTFNVKLTQKKDRKKWAIEYTKNVLTKKGDDTSLEWIFSFKKQDDVCDCVLMILSYLIKVFKIEI
jgi:hypothetical protein